MNSLRAHTGPVGLAALLVGIAALAVGVAALVRGGGDDSLQESPSTAEPAAFTRSYVQQAIDMYAAEGRERTLAHYSSEVSATGRWYLFVIDRAADELVLHPDPALLGAKSAQRRDVRGYAYGAELLRTTEAGQWVSYRYRTYDGDAPAEEGDKHSWVQLHDGLIFGSGWYENVVPLPTRDGDPEGYTQWFVQDAVDVYDAQGLDATRCWSAPTIPRAWTAPGTSTCSPRTGRCSRIPRRSTCSARTCRVRRASTLRAGASAPSS